MTSINVLRFNEYSGVFVGDESISSGEFNVDVSDKIQSVVPEIISDRYGTVAALGATGNCSVGSEMKLRSMRAFQKIYDDHFKAYGKAPDKFIGIPEMMDLIYEQVIMIRKDLLDAKVKGIYGFDTDDFNQGFYKKGDEKISIKNTSILSEVTDWMMWKHEAAAVKNIYMNAGVFGGYDEENGFLLYNLDFREGYYHEVQTCYRAEGSGRHSVDPHMYDFVENLLVEERRGKIEPAEGIVALLNAVNKAARHEIGIGGYFNIILVNGKLKKTSEKIREINDGRAYLSQIAVRAWSAGFLKYETAIDIIDQLLFENKPFESVYKLFMENIKPKKECLRFLRGYKIKNGRNPVH